MNLKNDLQSGPYPNIVGMDVPAVLTLLGGDLQLLQRLLSRFVDNVPASMQKVEHFIQLGQFDEAASIVHKLRGDAGNLRATVVFDITSKLESGLRHAGSGNGALLESLRVALDALMVSSREWLSAIPDNDSLQQTNRELTESESLALKTKLLELSSLLELGSVRSRRLSQEISEMIEGTALRNAFLPIRKQIDDFQFMDALVELKKTLL